MKKWIPFVNQGEQNMIAKLDEIRNFENINFNYDENFDEKRFVLQMKNSLTHFEIPQNYLEKPKIQNKKLTHEIILEKRKEKKDLEEKIEKKYKKYEVKNDDTLFGIALKFDLS